MRNNMVEDLVQGFTLDIPVIRGEESITKTVSPIIRYELCI